MKEKYRAYLPIWFLIMVPPMLFLLLGCNFIICLVGLLISLIILKTKNIFTAYSSKIFKLWGISVLLDIVAFLFLILPEMFFKVDFINNNLVTPLEYNPYTKLLSIIYMIILLIILIFLSYKLLNKFIFKDINGDKKNVLLVKIILVICTLPFLFFVPSTSVIKASKNNLEDFKGTLISDKTGVVSIMKYLSVSDYISSYVLDNNSKPYTINLYLDTIDVNYLEKFELDAATIFNVINDVETVNYSMGGNIYTYTLKDINEIFGNVKKASLDDIEARYSNSNFTDYIYLDHIGDYDLFDTSEACEENTEKLFTYEDATYYMNCSSLELIMLFKDNKKVMSLKDALDNNLITDEEVVNSLLPIFNDKQISE